MMRLCPKNRGLLFRLFKPIFDMSLFFKMGVVIVACVCITSIFSFYLYTQLKQIYEQREEDYSPYMVAAQVCLRSLNGWEDGRPGDLKPMRDVLEAGLKGGKFVDMLRGRVVQVAHFPAELPMEAETLLKRLGRDLRQIQSAKATDEMGRRAVEDAVAAASQLLEWATEKQGSYRRSLMAAVTAVSSKVWITVAIVALFLVWGAVAFLFMVLNPLREVTSRIQRLMLNQDHGEEEEDCLSDYYADDEIGSLVHSVNELVIYYRNMATFKHLIEEDETVEEVYERLGQWFVDEIGLTNFVIYQVSNSQNSMTIIQRHPPELEVNPAKLIDISRCRARRTGHVVSSLITPGCCRLFMWQDEAHHYCIPMMSAGQCVGVVQFLIPFGADNRRMKRIRRRLDLAERYIQEAIPVIEAKRYAQSLKEQSFKDELTGLYNRRFLDSVLENLVAGINRRETVLGVIMADIDFFKSVNDHYGHDIGDTVLREVAHIICTTVRRSDLAVRYGGEEFLILLVDIQEGQTERVAEKIRAAVEQYKIATPKGTITKTISLGVSEYPVDADAIWEAVKYADVALYKAKEQGRNRVVRFKPEMWQEEQY